MEAKYTFEKLVKIRIGEPITALALNRKLLVFGSISGYIGYMSLENMEVKYFAEIYDELIRCASIYHDQTAYIAVGDLQGLKIDFSEIDDYKITVIKYSTRDHNIETCSNTLAFNHKNFVALLTANPTQNKDIEKRNEKNKVYISNYDNGDLTCLDPFSYSTFTVPFDFDGKRFIWLEYKEKGKKDLVIYEYQEKKNLFFREFPKNVEFIAHCKLYNRWAVYVEENKHVKLIDTLKNEIKHLYSHKHQIIALNLMNFETYFEKNEELLNIEEFRDKNEENQPRENKPFNPINEIASLTIFTVDYESNVIVYRNDSMIHNFNLLNLNGLPKNLKQNKFLFDMGYPYYLASNGQKMAITCDFGILIFSL